jgi:hypothetical protein
MTTHPLTIDLVTERPDGAYVLVLVEHGPWALDATQAHLRRIQDRLYDCVDAAVDGHLAGKYPDSRGRPVVIRLDCFDTPDGPVRDFMERFGEAIANSEQVLRDLTAQGFVRSLGFEYNRRTLGGGDENKGDASDENNGDASDFDGP